MRNITLLIAIIGTLFGITSCKEEAKPPVIQEELTTFYLIRHAEKDLSDPNETNPELNQDGLGRAMRWAEILDFVELDAIYTTDFQRTSMTAAPIAIKKGIGTQFYDPQTLVVDDFKKENRHRNVLIVGHANTTPELTNALLGEQKYHTMDDDDHSSLFIVRIIDGRATAIRLKMD